MEDVDLVGSAASLPELCDLVEAVEPDVVITDIRMPPTGTDEGIRASAWIREHYPNIGVVVLSQFVDPGLAAAVMGHGSQGRGYLLKEQVANVSQLQAAIDAVANGGSFVDPLVVEALVDRGGGDDGRRLGNLTARELEVLREVASGKTNTAIAAELFVGERAVEKHINSIFSKLRLGDEPGLHKRVAAVVLYLSDRGAG
jgi:DNA-binding NarL/FixJ family response regulator